MRAETAVGGHGGPLIAEHPRLGLSVIHHRLDGEDHAFTQPGTVSTGAEVRNLRLFVQARPDTMAYKLAHYAESGGFDVLLNRRAHISDRIADPHLLDAAVQRGFGYFQQLLQFRLD